MTSLSSIHSANRLSAFDALLIEVAARREEIDRLTHVPRDLVESMKRAGMFRAGTPRRFGGDALPPATFLEMVERVSQVDGSAGWVSAFGSANTFLASLPIETQQMIYAEGPDQVFAGGLNPPTVARAVDGGWIASGQWRFASGCMGADWIGIAMLTESDDPGSAKPIVRLAVAPAAEVEIIRNWDVVGMRGTGSYDTRVTDKFYRREWTCDRLAPPLIDEPLYRYPAQAFQAQVHAVVNLGLARAALDTALEMSEAANPVPGVTALADRSYFRTALAKAEADWRSARAFFYETAEQAWEVLLAGDTVAPALTNMLRLSAAHAAHTCADAVQDIFRVAGMAAIQKTNRLQQIARDAMVITQHATLNEAIFDDAGSMLVGTECRSGYP